MAELEELEQEELDKNLLEISGPETVPLPNVPSISIPSKPGMDGVLPETSWIVSKYVYCNCQLLRRERCNCRQCREVAS